MSKNARIVVLFVAAISGAVLSSYLFPSQPFEVWFFVFDLIFIPPLLIAAWRSMPST